MIGREEKYRILTTNPSLDPTCYPHTHPYKSGSFRQFQPQWLKQYPWLYHSKHVHVVFCCACAFFAPNEVGGQLPGQFVGKPFNTRTKKTQAMNTHAGVNYHLDSLTKMSEFIEQ